jgi:short-subunit dehydrogenase
MGTHLITGGASGIGAALADRLHTRGEDLYLVVRSERRAEDVRERWAGVQAVVADLERPDTLTEALDGRFPDRIDSLVHSAAMVHVGPVAELTAAHWARTLALNLAAPAELTRMALPALRAAAGHVVFVNSGAGLRAGPAWSAYAASKFGLRALADALRAEEHAAGVRVTSVYPGPTATAMQTDLHRQQGEEYAFTHFIEPDSVAAAILAALDLPRDAELTELSVRPGG